MPSVFLLCLIVGAAALIVQIVLSTLGLDADAPDGFDFDVDAGADAGAGDGLDLLSVRTVSAAAVLFGAVGLWLDNSGVALVPTTAAALAAGAAAAVGTAFLTRQILRFESDGTLRLENAIGQPGTVYIPVPARRGGTGRVQLRLQGRTVELRAVADEQNELPTGTPVTVVAVVDGDTVEVLMTPLIEGVDT